MSAADVLLSRLDKVRRTGQDRWQARCPAHEDRGPSLSVRELPDGRVLVHCFADCATDAVLAGVGLTFSDLYPEPLVSIGGPASMKPERRPFPAADVLRCVGFEALVVAMAGIALLDDRPFKPDDRLRLMLAVRRLVAAVDAAGVGHHG